MNQTVHYSSTSQVSSHTLPPTPTVVMAVLAHSSMVSIAHLNTTKPAVHPSVTEQGLFKIQDTIYIYSHTRTTEKSGVEENNITLFASIGKFLKNNHCPCELSLFFSLQVVLLCVWD